MSTINTDDIKKWTHEIRASSPKKPVVVVRSKEQNQIIIKYLPTQMPSDAEVDELARLIQRQQVQCILAMQRRGELVQGSKVTWRKYERKPQQPANGSHSTDNGDERTNPVRAGHTYASVTQQSIIRSSPRIVPASAGEKEEEDIDERIKELKEMMEKKERKIEQLQRDLAQQQEKTSRAIKELQHANESLEDRIMNLENRVKTIEREVDHSVDGIKQLSSATLQGQRRHEEQQELEMRKMRQQNNETEEQLEDAMALILLVKDVLYELHSESEVNKALLRAKAKQAAMDTTMNSDEEGYCQRNRATDDQFEKDPHDESKQPGRSTEGQGGLVKASNKNKTATDTRNRKK